LNCNIMGHQSISTPDFEHKPQRAIPRTSRRNRCMLIAGLLSVGVHLAAGLLVVLAPRLVPNDLVPLAQGTVELLMIEQQGAQPSPATQPTESKRAPAQKIEAPKPDAPQDQPPTRASQPTPPFPSAQTDEAVPPPVEPTPQRAIKADPQPAPKQIEGKPSPPKTQVAPAFDLAGTESESNAIVMGGQVLPAMKDDRFRNRPPAYPMEAQMHGQSGSVVVVIHVDANGMAAEADVLESSGHALLDQAALVAVRKWHFHPAMQAGRSVPFDMPFRFIFEPN